MIRGSYSSRLSLLQIDDRINPALPIGSLGPINSDFVTAGWTFDPDTKSQPIQAHLYIDGQFVGVVNADQYREDVNSYYGITGNHGYSTAIPSQFIDTHQHALTIYAIDSQGGPNPVIGTSTFTDQATIGVWEGLRNDGYLSGWAYDPDNSSASINIVAYVNNQYVSLATANIYRDVVNRERGITGNHGFGFYLPQQYVNVDHYRRAVQLYALDGAVNNTGSVNFSLGNRTFQSADQFISGPDASGSPIVIGTAERFAGAINSLTWGGKQFIDSADHGREMQSAVITDAGRGVGGALGEDYNPTEAGSVTDGSGPNTSSYIDQMSADSIGNLVTSGQMAFWHKYNGRTISDFWHYKKVNIGAYQDLPNVIRYENGFWVPPAENTQYAQFEMLTAYMPNDINQFYSYNPSNGQVLFIGVTPPNSSTEQSLPVIATTPDGHYTIAIVTERTGSILPSSSVPYGRWDFTPLGSAVTKLSTVYRISGTPSNPVAGIYTFKQYVVVGNFTMVLNSLNALRTRINIATG